MKYIIDGGFLSDCNWTRTQNELVCNRKLNHLVKWLSVHLQTKWFWVRVQLQSLKLQISRKEFLDIQTLKRVHDMTRTYSQEGSLFD